MSIHHHRPPKHTALRSDNTLHVVAVISNPVRYASRYRLYEQFAAHMETFPEVRLTTVELAFGDRHHEVTHHATPERHVQVRSSSELWHKENLINLGVRALPRDWKYVAWVDADVQFVNRGWAQETLHQLQHHAVVQCFEDAIDMGPRNNVVDRHQSFGKLYATGATRPRISGEPYSFWHPGFAWACRREFYENVGGLIDFAILGAADHHMALALIGAAKDSLPGGIHPSYARRVMEWQDRALRAGKRDLGFVEGALMHHWHGSKKKRYYVERWSLLTSNQYNPDVDVRYSHHGVLELTGNKPRLRDDLRSYFRARAEDSFDD